MIKVLRDFFAPTIKDFMGQSYNLYDVITELQDKIERLEYENMETTNCLYEIENRLQSEIDRLREEIYSYRKQDQ